MSLEYIYKLNNSEFSMNCPEPTVLDSLAESCPDEMNDIFHIDEPDEMIIDDPKTDVESDKIIKSIVQVLKAIRKNKEIVPYTYYLYEDHPIFGKSDFKGTGLFMIPDDDKHYFSLCTMKANCCNLEKYPILDNKQSGTLIDRKDVSDVPSFETITKEGQSTIFIKKRRGKFPLTADLKKLKKFIEENGPGTVTKIFCG